MLVGFMTRYFMVTIWGFRISHQDESLHRVAQNMFVKPCAQYVTESLLILLVLLDLLVWLQLRGWHCILFQILQRTGYVYL